MALIDNLISYYSLDEASGDAIDAHSTNDLDERTASAVGATTGKVNGCRDFEESTSGSSFRYSDATLHNFGDEDFTIACWINPESIAANMWIITKLAGAGLRQYALLFSNSSGTLQWRVSNDGTAIVNETWGAFDLSTGTWYFIVAWHDSVNNVIGLSVNDGTAETTAHSTGVFQSSQRFSLGAVGNSNASYDGLMDEVGVWGRVLTSSERTELYNSGNGRDYAYISGGGGGVAIPVFRHHYRQQGIL
jgi:hypothetical protein